jgi:hypothetical protein
MISWEIDTLFLFFSLVPGISEGLNKFPWINSHIILSLAINNYEWEGKWNKVQVILFGFLLTIKVGNELEKIPKGKGKWKIVN